jgi:hypothetical protein
MVSCTDPNTLLGHLADKLTRRQWRLFALACARRFEALLGPHFRHAIAVYETRDFAALPVLADALEEAGCSEPALLRHLRRPGDHIRGCWALELVPGKK